MSAGPAGGSRPGVRVRALEETDWPQVHDLVTEVARAGETYSLDVPAGVARTRAFWAAEHLVVAVDGDVVLGAAKAGPNRPGQGSHVGTASFMVSSAARGRGVGRTLGEHVIGWHREAGFRAIQFNAVVATNTAAVALWLSLGFRVVGRVPEAFRRPSGELADLLVMHLDLTEGHAGRGAGGVAAPGPDGERTRVLDAALRLFPTQGYAGTSMGQVAAQAGLSTSRVTRLLGAKGEVFSAMVWREIVGDHPDLQTAFDALGVEEEPEVEVRLDLVADAVARMSGSVAHLIPVMVEAAARDATVAGIVQGAELQRVGSSRRLVHQLSRGGQPGPDAVPEVQMLCSAETYRSLSGFGWSRERYVAWLRSALDRAVNGQDAVPAGSRGPDGHDGAGRPTARLPR